ncbi:MAG: tetratricopeptide repeat protein [Myxococcota bacterium]
MTHPHDLLRGELERHFALDEMTRLSLDLMGYDPKELGGSSSSGTFARALVERAERDHALEALADAIALMGKTAEVDGVFDVRVGRGLEAGETIGGFEITKTLADGGLGRVYETTATIDGKPVTAALKVIRSSLSRDPSAVARYLTTQRALRRIASPGLAHVLGVGTLSDGRPWVATELAPGETLAARVGRVGPMHVRDVAQLFDGVLTALIKLHAAGLVQSDVKAGNIFVSRDGEGPLQGMLVDGGVYKLLAAGATRQNAMGALRIFGSAEAIAPEMARGEGVGPAADLYGLGVALYTALTGRPPFVGETSFDVIAQHLSAEPAAPSSLAPQGWVSPEVDAFVLKALAKDPARRFGSAAAMERALRDIVGSVGTGELDQAAFAAAKKALLAKPGGSEEASNLEKVAAAGGAFGQAVDALYDAEEAAKDAAAKKALFFRIARLQATHLKDSETAEATYRQILEIDPQDGVALSGLEELLRTSERWEPLGELLLERAETIESAQEQASLFREIGALYLEKLGDPDNALVAYTQALADEPRDEETATAIERIASGDTTRWNEVLTTLNEHMQEGDDDPLPLWLLMGRWYAEHLKRPDFAIPCYAKALEIDPQNDAAYEGTLDLYRKAQSWQEYAQLLVSRASASTNPARARDFKAQAAEVTLDKLSDQGRAVAMFQAILEEDPAHPDATAALAKVYEDKKDWDALASLLQDQARQAGGSAKVTALLRLGELYEDRLNDVAKATVQYEAALAADSQSLDALKGLERIHARSSNYGELLEVLGKQLEVVPTPRQRVQVLTQVGGLQEEEFGDHEKAAAAFEAVALIDPGNEDANPALSRLYRRMGRFDDLVKTLERHAGATADERRRIDLLLKAARTLITDVGAPERALELCDRVLQVDPKNVEALGLTTRIKAQLGDAAAAIDAADKLAASAKDDLEKIERLMEAGRLLEEAGDKDRAIDRYKKALDVIPNDAKATAALRRLYTERGDAQGAAELLKKEMEVAEGDGAKAQLLAELGMLTFERLGDEGEAERLFERALELDGTNTLAFRGIGDMAYAAGKFAKAAGAYEPLLARLGEMDDATAKSIALRTGDAFRDRGDFDKAQRAYLNAKAYAPNDRSVIERVADASFRAGAMDEAAELYRELLEKAGDQLVGGDKGLVLLRQGIALTRAGATDEGLPLLVEASELRPEDPEAAEALEEAYRAKGDYESVVKVLRRRMLSSEGQERFDLLVKVGDVLSEELDDRTTASKSYVAALEIVPDDRNLLTKLMAVYSESRDWARLIEVVLRISELVDDRSTLAKYFLTAASISHYELGNTADAVGFYGKALDNDPTLEKAFEGLIQCLEAAGDEDALAAAYDKQIARLGEGTSSEKLAKAKLLDRLGALRLASGDPSAAREAYEAARVLDPRDRMRLERLAELYEGGAAGEAAAEVHSRLLSLSPFRTASYQALKMVYEKAGNSDGVWCVAQALRELQMAGPDEEALFKAYRRTEPFAPSAKLDGAAYDALVRHPDQDARITRVFAAMVPAVLQNRAQRLDAYGLSEGDKRDAASAGAIATQLGNAATLLGIELPELYARAGDPGGLSMVLTATPAVGLGEGAQAGGPAQALAVVAGRHLATYRRDALMYSLVPSAGSLRAWLLAAVRLVQPAFPVPPNLQSRSAEALSSLQRNLSATGRDQVRGQVQALLEDPPELDMRRWMQGVELTADRVGFLLAGDLAYATAVVRAGAEELVPERTRLEQLTVYAVSREYLQLREMLGLRAG